jgi:hypothetical protein
VAVLAVQFVEALAIVLDQLTVHAARQLQALYERVAWVAISRVSVRLEVPLSVVRIAWIVKPTRVVDVEAVTVARVVVTGIEIQSALPDGVRRLITPDYRRRNTSQQ